MDRPDDAGNAHVTGDVCKHFTTGPGVEHSLEFKLRCKFKGEAYASPKM
jgi:hypothetical protein